MASTAVSDQVTLGARVAQLRRRLDLRQQDVADHLGIPRSAVAMLEHDHRHLSLEEAARLAELLRCSLDTLAGQSTAQIDAYEDAYARGYAAGHAAIAEPIEMLLKATAPRDEAHG